MGGGDRIQRYFDIYLFLCVVDIFLPSSSSARERAKERERERDDRRSRIRASLYAFTFPREGRSSSFIHSSSCPNLIIWCLRSNTKNEIFFVFYFLFFRFLHSNRWMMGLDSNHIFILTHYKKLLNNKIGRRATTPIRLRDRSRGKV